MNDMVLDAYRDDEDGVVDPDDSESKLESGGLFDDSGARSGYALGFLFGRATNLVYLLFNGLIRRRTLAFSIFGRWI